MGFRLCLYMHGHHPAAPDALDYIEAGVVGLKGNFVPTSTITMYLVFKIHVSVTKSANVDNV